MARRRKGEVHAAPITILVFGSALGLPAHLGAGAGPGNSLQRKFRSGPVAGGTSPLRLRAMKTCSAPEHPPTLLGNDLALAAALHSTMKGGGAGDYAAVNDSPRCYGRRRDRINAVHNI